MKLDNEEKNVEIQTLTPTWKRVQRSQSSVWSRRESLSVGLSLRLETTSFFDLLIRIYGAPASSLFTAEKKRD